MDIKEIKTHLPLLHSVKKCPGNCERNILLSHMDDKTFNFVCKWIGKSIQDPSMLKLGTRGLKTLRKNLERDKKRIKYLTKRGGNINRKKKAVKQSGEGIGMLLGVLAPILINLVKSLVSSKKKKS